VEKLCHPRPFYNLGKNISGFWPGGLKRLEMLLAHWWDEDKCAKVIDATWYDFNTFLCGYILSPCRKVSCTKPVKAVKQSPRIEAMSFPSHAKEATAVVSVQSVSVAMKKSSQKRSSLMLPRLLCALKP
jgi:hypothetical protein